MRLLPHRSFTIETGLPPDEVLARLAAAVEPLRVFGWWTAKKPFQGEVNAEEFRIVRVPGIHNSFVPEISGRVIPTPNGSRIEGTMSLHSMVQVGMVVFFGYAAFIALVLVGVAVVSGTGYPAILAPFGLILFGWALSAACFAIEAPISLRTLHEIVAAEADTPAASPAS